MGQIAQTKMIEINLSKSVTKMIKSEENYASEKIKIVRLDKNKI